MINLNKKLKKVFVALFLLFYTATLYGQTIHIVDNTSGDPGVANSLPNLIGKALGTAGANEIIFKIPGAGPFIINTTNAQACNIYNSVACTSLLIDATTQTGYVSGAPIVILRGNGGGTCFHVGESNVTVKGFVVQNYSKGFYQYGGTANAIENCWFGVDVTGTTSSAAVSIKEFGIQTEPSAVVSVGSKTDFTAATRNVVSGCGKNGICLNGASGSYVGNTFVGTDITGTVGIANGTTGGGNEEKSGLRIDNAPNTIVNKSIISYSSLAGVYVKGSSGTNITDNKIGTDITGTKALGNGTSLPSNSEFQHGLLIQGSQNVVVRGNVISANTSGGIDIRGNSDNATITANKIGTDISGNLPLGNNTFGIRIEGSKSHTIGGVSKADGNIISANGTDLFPFLPYNRNDPTKYDWYNSSGIYLTNTNTVTIQNNNIGVGASGNSSMAVSAFDLGNFYCGVKIENGSFNVTVSNNIVSGNGFRSNLAYLTLTAPPVTDPLKGHGVLIKDATTSGNIVTGNYIGIGANGTTKIGNKEDGISIQGATGTVIGGASPALRNVISGNIWGIKIASNYYDSQSSDIKIYGNYIGTNALGNAVIGNQDGGIGVAQYSHNTIIGGIGLGNLISGNKIGISIGERTGAGLPNAGLAPTGTTVIGNSIGLSQSGATLIPNTEHGIYLYDDANNTTIGGLLATQANRIIGNGASGIYADRARDNNIIGNIITNNTNSGILLNASINNTLRKNTVATNGASGVVLQAASNGNKLYANTIGDLADVAKANNGEGIYISASANNFIGSSTAGDTNYIARNTGNGILIEGLSSTKNAIHANVFSCNLLRGIELGTGANVANNNFQAPTFSGTPTSLIVTGPVANSWIELYALDPCNNCATGTNNKLQGRKLIAQGPSPLNYTQAVAGVFYTATASESNSATVAHNTSAFSSCYTLCPTSNLSLTVSTNSPVCTGNPVIVTIANSELGRNYQVMNGTTAVSASVSGTGNNLPITTTLSVAGTYTLSINVGRTGCTPQTLSQRPVVVINSTPILTLGVTSNSPVCVGNSAIVTIANSELGKTYEVFNGTTSVSSVVPGTGNNLSITLNTLIAGNYTLTIRVRAGGCTAQDLSQKPVVIINSTPILTLGVTSNSPVCVGNSAIVTIANSELGKTYEVFNGTTSVSSVVPGTGNNLPITLNTLVAGTYTLTIRVRAGGCTAQDLSQKPVVVINTTPILTLGVTSNSPVCIGNSAIVTIANSETGKTYEVFNGTTSVSSVVSGTGANLPITLNTLVAGTYTLTIRVRAGGCVAQDLSQKPVVVINSTPVLTLGVTSNSPVCIGNSAIVTIANSESGKTYEVFNGTTSVSSVVPGTGANLPITLNTLVAGTYTLTIRVRAGGCTAQDLSEKPIVVINDIAKTNLVVTTNSPVCRGSAATLSVAASEIGKTYQVFTGSTQVSQPVPGNGGLLTIPLTFLNSGTFPLTISVSVGGCAPAVLDAKPTFVVNIGSDPNLTVSHNGPICFGSQATVTILKTEIGVIYQAIRVIDNATVSTQVTGDGSDKVLNVTLLTGPNVVRIKTSVAGCGDGQLIQEARMFVDTTVLKGLTASAISPICLGETSVVTILKSQLYKGYLVMKNKVAVSDTVIGTGGTITIPVPNLPVGDHKFTISVISNGCKDDTLLQNPSTKVNSAPDASLKVGTNGPVCDGKQALFYVLKSEIGKKYQIFDGASSVSQIKDGNGDTLKIELNDLDTGSYTLVAKVTTDGCNVGIDLNDRGTIRINSIPKTNLTATVNGPVCLNNPAIVTVLAAEKGKSYQVFYKGISVSPSLLGTGGGLDLPVSTVSMPAGEHDLSIAISVPGCTVDTLQQKPRLTINDKPDTDNVVVSAVKSPICVGTDGAVLVTGIQSNVFYQAYINTEQVSDNLAGTNSLTLSILANKLKIGMNNISIMATIAGCDPILVKDTAGIKVNGNPEINLAFSAVPLVICKGGESILTIATSEAGVSYQAVLEDGTVVSNAVLSDGGKVELILVDLPEGISKVEVMASVGGCDSKKLNGSVSVTVNPGPKLDYSVLGSTVCKPQAGTVTISGSETTATYEAFNKTTNTQVSNTFPGTGGAVVLDLFPSNNEVDTIIIKANVIGCGVVRLDSSAVVYTNDLTISKELATEGSTICINDGNATATILLAKVGVSYQAKLNNEKFETLVGTGANLVFSIPRSSLVKGANSIRFTAKVKGCDSIDLANPAIVIVNDPTTFENLETLGSTICVNDLSASATILRAISGVKYQVFVNNNPQPNILEGKDADLVFNIARSELNLGTNNIRFTGQIAGCTPTDLANGAQIIINDNTTSKDLPVEGSVVCRSNDFAKATIKGAKSGIQYDAYNAVGGRLGNPMTGDGGDLVFSIPVSQLNNGDNYITFYASVAGCDRVKLDNQALVIVNGTLYAIEGDPLVCFYDTGTYSIAPIPGITKYNWKKPQGAKFLTDSTLNIIEVAFDKISGMMEVVPEGSAGACDGLQTKLDVQVLAPLVDTVRIIGTDTLCVNSKDWIKISEVGIFNVDSIRWTWKGTFEFDSIYHKDTLNQIFEVRYPKVGSDTVIAVPYEKCSSTYQYSKSDTLFVTVLGKPVAEAGEYATITNDFGDVVLTGKGSTTEGQFLHDSITYNWSSKQPNVQIVNPKTLNNASTVVSDEETMVYLEVLNHGRCPSRDSATIKFESSLVIPNIFTPNNDGNHDTWEIKNLHKLYPNCKVEIFNKWGSSIFKSTGYAEPWDGTRNGEEMPVATYYYIVDLNTGRVPYVQSVTILR